MASNDPNYPQLAGIRIRKHFLMNHSSGANIYWFRGESLKGKPDGAALQRHNTENSKQIFPEKELCGPSPNCHLHVSVSDLYTPTIGLPILLQENVWTNPGNTVYKSPTDT
jgi:hypothetical protein